MILTESGKVYGTGANSCAKVGALDDVVISDVVCGGCGTFFLSSQSCVYASGSNRYGQLALSCPATSIPMLISEPIFESDCIEEIYAGEVFTIFQTRSQNMYFAGVCNPTSDSQSKNPIQKLKINNYSEIRSGKRHISVVFKDGTAGFTQLPDGSDMIHYSVPNDFLEHVIDRDLFTIFMGRSGSLYGLRVDTNGCLSEKKFETMNRIGNFPYRLSPDDVVAGGYHLIFRVNRNQLFAAGLNGFGQCGQGNTERLPLPTEITHQNLRNFVTLEVENKSRELRVACGASHTIIYSAPRKSDRLSMFYVKLSTCHKFRDVSIVFNS